MVAFLPQAGATLSGEFGFAQFSRRPSVDKERSGRVRNDELLRLDQPTGQTLKASSYEEAACCALLRTDMPL